MIYIASEGVDLKGNVKSTGGSRVLTPDRSAVIFAQGKRMCVIERLR